MVFRAVPHRGSWWRQHLNPALWTTHGGGEHGAGTERKGDLAQMAFGAERGLAKDSQRTDTDGHYGKRVWQWPAPSFLPLRPSSLPLRLAPSLSPRRFLRQCPAPPPMTCSVALAGMSLVFLLSIVASPVPASRPSRRFHVTSVHSCSHSPT